MYATDLCIRAGAAGRHPATGFACVATLPEPWESPPGLRALEDCRNLFYALGRAGIQSGRHGDGLARPERAASVRQRNTEFLHAAGPWGARRAAGVQRSRPVLSKSALPSSGSWQAAFTEAFGIREVTSTQAFEEYRRRDRPGTTASGRSDVDEPILVLRRGDPGRHDGPHPGAVRDRAGAVLRRAPRRSALRRRTTLCSSYPIGRPRRPYTCVCRGERPSRTAVLGRRSVGATSCRWPSPVTFAWQRFSDVTFPPGADRSRSRPATRGI